MRKVGKREVVGVLFTQEQNRASKKVNGKLVQTLVKQNCSCLFIFFFF